MTGCEGLPEEVRSGAEERLGVEDKVGGRRAIHAYLYICMHTYDYTIPTYGVYVYNVCVYTVCTYICMYAVYDLHIMCLFGVFYYLTVDCRLPPNALSKGSRFE